MMEQDSLEAPPPASTPAHTGIATASTPASPSWTAAFGSKKTTPVVSSPLASGAGRLNNLKAGLSKLDTWLFEDTSSPSRSNAGAAAHAARTKSPPPARSPPPSASATPSSSSQLAAPVVIKAAAPSPVAGASSGGSGGGLNWGASFESFKQKLMQSGSSLEAGHNEEEEEEAEHPGAVGFGGGHRRPSPRQEEEEEEEAPVQPEPVVDEAQRAWTAAALVEQELALAEGATVMVMHRGKGLPLAALEAETRALVTLRWARLHLTPAYWTESNDLDRDPANYIAREEPLPALDDQMLYTPSTDDHGCLLAVHLTSAAPQQGTTTVSRRLLTARPVELDARVKAVVETALGASTWVSPCGVFSGHTLSF